MCTYYGKLGHTVDKCYRLHGFPLGYKFKNKTSTAHQVSSASQGQYHNQMVMPLQEAIITHSPITIHAPSFTPNQY